jgi:hypothetical protein
MKAPSKLISYLILYKIYKILEIGMDSFGLNMNFLGIKQVL